MGHRVTAAFGDAVSGPCILVHGGAGSVPVERRAEHELGCRIAAEAGWSVLAEGGSALDAVERAVRVLEDDPRFNAGTGACLTEDGHVELDASIMEGTRLRVGGVCALPPFANPIAIARAVLEDGRHVLYAGAGAEAFATAKGFARVPEEQLVTEAARQALARAKATGSSAGFAGGTVGAVARDAQGHVAAATSTGGRSNKRAGRVGDSPIAGAGNYADDAAGACSATGDGEGILRVCLAKTILDAVRAGTSPEEAARSALEMLSERVDATGGVIVLGARGGLGLARSTETMSWAARAFGWDAPRSGH
jgi:beta-aspartyl-peptidase (threonine type)